MRNPFLNTDHYTVVQQYNKMNNKKRSYSNSSQSSNWSGYSSGVSDHAYDYKDSTHKRRYNQQYLMPNSRTPIYQIQRRRAEVFGVQQLRYKPAYFQHMNTNHLKNQYKGKQVKIKAQQSINKSSKSIKQIKFMSPSSQDIKFKERQNKSVESTKPDRIVESLPTQKKRTSGLQQLVQINICHAKSNQFYGSIADLKSKNQLFRISLNSQGSYQNPYANKSNKIKKCSVFHDQNDRFHEIMKKMSQQFEQQQFQSQRGTLTQSKKLMQSQCKSKNEIIDMDLPQIIIVRQKKYFLYKYN